jgi:integrase
MPIVNLNANFVKHHLQCKSGRSTEFTSRDLPGFFVEVSAVSPGVGSYRLRYKENGKTRYKSIGRTYEIEFSTAKQLAREYKSQLTLGQDIKDNSSNEKDSLTYSDLFAHYKKFILQRKKSSRADIGKYNTRVKQEFGSMKLREIERHQIQQFITELREEGLAPATCDRYLQMIRYSLRCAVDWGYLEKNPADKIPLFNADNKVENYLSDEEMTRLMGVLKTDENRVVCSLVLFLLATGARLMEAQMAKWEHIDLENRVWRIPITKSQRVRSCPINSLAIEAL